MPKLTQLLTWSLESISHSSCIEVLFDEQFLLCVSRILIADHLLRILRNIIACILDIHEASRRPAHILRGIHHLLSSLGVHRTIPLMKTAIIIWSPELRRLGSP